MRTLTSKQIPVAAANARGEFLRVEIKDAGGTWRDLGSYPGYDSVESASWGEDVDSPHATCEVVLKREFDNFSVAPLMENAAANRQFNPSASYVPLVYLNRELRISVAIVPADTTPVSADWMVVFHGRVDTIDEASNETQILQCRDLAGTMAQTWIEEERVYSFGSVSSVPVSMRIWRPSTVYTAGEYVLPTEAKRNSKFYKVTTGGTSASTEPTWPAAGTVNNGSVVFTFQDATSTAGHDVEDVMQNILDDNGLSSVLLYTPTTPGWAIKQYIQRREPVLEALRGLAQQIGWDVRYKWRSATSQFEFTFFQPDRSKVAIDRTFSASEYTDVNRLSLDISGIRNAIRVIYPRTATLDAAGNPTRTTIEVTDGTSISTYGRLFMEISEADSSQIDTATEATSMANAALADLKDPKAEQSIELSHGFPWAELGDLYRFTANNRHYSSDQDWAMYSVRHMADHGRMRTTIETRGKPSAGFDRWHAISGSNNQDEVKDVQQFSSGAGLTVVAIGVIGGARITVTPSPERAEDGGLYEFHISGSSGFTPSSSTLKTVSRSRRVEITDLNPDSTYYTKVVPSYLDGGVVVRGQPSEQVSFVAGKAFAAHLYSQLAHGVLPLNGSFETQFDTTLPPDHWQMLNGTWNTHWGLVSDGSSVSGKHHIQCKGVSTNPGSSIQSDFFNVSGGANYWVSFWVKSNPANPALRAFIAWYDQTETSLGESQVAQLNTVGTAWTHYMAAYQYIATAPAAARYGRVYFLQAILDTKVVDIDEVQVFTPEPQESWSAPSLLNSWTNVGGGNVEAGFMMDRNGRVHIRGHLGGGTTTDGTTIFTLPSGYRPLAIHHFVTWNEGASANRQAVGIAVLTNGNVNVYSFAAATRSNYLSLGGIHFDTR